MNTQQLIRSLVLFASLGVAAPALSEDIWHPGGKRPVLTVKEKVRRSLAQASLAAEGRFVELHPAGQLEPLDDAKGIHPVEFRVTGRLGGAAPEPGTQLLLRLVAYRPAAARAAAADRADLARSQEFERRAGCNLVAVDQYTAALTRACAPLLSSPDYFKDFFIVPVAVGALDAPYRVADVVVQFHKRYVIFVLRDPDAGNAVPLLPSGLDIYDADDPDVRAVLAQPG